MKKTKRKIALMTLIVFAFTIICAFGTVMADDSALPSPVAHYTFDKDVFDSSGNNNNGTITSTKGGQGVSIVKGVNGNGARFDGASYIEIPHSNSLNLSGNFSFSVWLYKDDVRPNEDEPILEKTVPIIDEEPSSDGVAYQMTDSLDETFVQFTGSDSSLYNSNGYTYNDFQKWNLLTVTGDGQTIKYYLNGTQVYKQERAYSITNSTGALHIGVAGSADGEYFKGVMDDLMIFNSTLTPLQISMYYKNIYDGTGNAVLAKRNALVAHYKFEGNFKDSSEYGNNGPESSVHGITFEQGKIGKAARFNGASYIEIPDSDSLDLKDSYTFSLWLKRDKKADNGYPILSKNCSSFAEGKEDAYTLFAANDATYVRYFSNVFDQNNTAVYGVVPDNTWHMLTVTNDGKELKYYLNGKLADKKKVPNVILSSSGKLIIGNTEWTDSYFFKGTMDDLRIYNYVLPELQISNLYTQTDRLASTPVKVDSLAVNASKQLKIDYIALGSASSVDITASATYSTSDAKVAKVVKGKVTGLKKGRATITVTYGGNSVNIPVVVK